MPNPTLRCSYILGILVALLVAGCASEDENIVNPKPGSADIRIRFLNLMPDNTPRRMLLERNVQTLEIPTGGVSPLLVAPGDSSLIEILTGATTEVRNDKRERFNRGSIYDVLVVGDTLNPTKADTILVFNASQVLTTSPLAQVRVINVVAERDAAYQVRLGCPSGPLLTSGPLAFRQGSTYNEVPPGFTVFTLVRTTPRDTTILGTYECTLQEYVPYSIIFYSSPAGGSQPAVLLMDESDTSGNVSRPLVPVVARNADIRVINVGLSPATVTVQASGQTLSSALATGLISSMSQVTTCDRITADVFELKYDDGRTATDSISLNVRQSYTIISADTADQARIIIIPPPQRFAGTAGKSILRVTHASATAGAIVVSIGARTDASSANGFSAGKTLASNLTFDHSSSPFAEAPGSIPITISTAKSPTTVLAIMRLNTEADRAYELIVGDSPTGGIAAYLIDDDDVSVPLVAAAEAVVVSVVNASPTNDFETISLGSVVNNARVFYGGSFTTSVEPVPLTMSVNSASASLDPVVGLRTLAIYAEAGGVPGIINMNALPMLIEPGSSQRRVINATSDAGFVSVAYDSIPAVTPDAEKLADRIAFGQSSVPALTTKERRGTFYVYNSDSLEELFQLPVNFGPLGNSYTLIVAGSKSKGYDVIILQEY